MPQFDDEIKEQLETDLEQFFTVKQGRGFVCTVEMTERTNGKYYFAAYPDDYADNTRVHDAGGNLVVKTVRKTFEVVFVYDSVEGSCDIAARTAKAVITALQNIFLRNVLGIQVPEEEKKPFDLSPLLAPGFTPETLPEDNIEVFVTGIKYALGKEYAVEHTAKGSQSVLANALLHIEEVKRDYPKITAEKARFRFVFKSAVGRSKTMTFNITSTGSCDLKKQPPERITKAHYYLNQWRIEYAVIERPSFTAAGVCFTNRMCQGPEEADSLGTGAQPFADTATHSGGILVAR